MTRQSLTAGLIALALVAAAVGGILYSTRKNRVELRGEILKVRSHMIDPENTIAVVDFRVHNPSSQQFVVREIEVFVDTSDQKPVSADVFSEIDARRMFDYYKVLGAKYNATLLTRDKIEPGETLDRMIAVRFPGPDASLQERKALRLVIHDVDRAKSEVVERR